MEINNPLATNQNKHKWLLTVAIVFFIVFFLFSLSILIFNIYYKDKVFPGSYYGKTSMTGLTRDQVKQIVEGHINKVTQDGFVFTYKEEKAIIKPIITAELSDYAFELVNFDSEATINEIFKSGRSGNIWWDLLYRTKLLFYHDKHYLKYALNEESLKGILSDSFKKYDKPAKNASLSYDPLKNFSIDDEKYGQTLNFTDGVNKMKEYLNYGETTTINLELVKSEPTIFKKDCQNVINDAKELAKIAPFKLAFEKKEWPINQYVVSGWFGLEKNSETSKIIVVPDKEKISLYLKNYIAPKIDIEPKNSKFTIENGKVKEFQVSQVGKRLNATSSANKIIAEIFDNKATSTQLIVNEINNIVSQEELDNLIVKEIIGTGVSNFSGSPVNRRHNIRVGAGAVNGTLVKPDEEFSLLKTLGRIDGTTGYRQELVIKENKTIPEYGGGLCQIGTTVFRGALDTGLPITARRNHSYRVQYYEPAGTDAAVYDPQPDVRFVNDTGNYILIQSRISGNYLYFDFWGTSDGRKVAKTKPTIYNIVKPAPTKLIESPDMKPGEKKCTEKAHNGADAYFDYQVTYLSGEVKQRRFSSHYVPWQEVCLVSVGSGTASSTPSGGGGGSGAATVTTNKTETTSNTTSTPIKTN